MNLESAPRSGLNYSQFEEIFRVNFARFDGN